MATNNLSAIASTYEWYVEGYTGAEILAKANKQIISVSILHRADTATTCYIYNAAGSLLGSQSIVDWVADFSGSPISITDTEYYYVVVNKTGQYNDAYDGVTFPIVCTDINYTRCVHGGSPGDWVYQPGYLWLITNVVTQDIPGSASNSPSYSPSVSESPSYSPSASESPSYSPSSSVSPSPSIGYADYSRESNAALPSTDAPLSTLYDAGEVSDVESKDNVYVEQETTGDYAIHQFKNFVTDSGRIIAEWYGKTNLDCSLSTVYLQIYNYDSAEWENMDSDSTTAADTNFSLLGDIADSTNYQQGGVTTCRVWQKGT